MVGEPTDIVTEATGRVRAVVLEQPLIYLRDTYTHAVTLTGIVITLNGIALAARG
jgi:hypothetical protein